MSASRSDTIIHERDYESALEGRTSWFLRASASGRNRGDLAVRYGISEGPVSICGRPLQDRENVWIVAARGRMLSSVRPVMRQEDSRRPVWEFADRVQITHSVLEAQWKALVVPAPSRRLLRHTLLPLALTSSRSWSAYAATAGVL